VSGYFAVVWGAVCASGNAYATLRAKRMARAGVALRDFVTYRFIGQLRDGNRWRDHT